MTIPALTFLFLVLAAVPPSMDLNEGIKLYRKGEFKQSVSLFRQRTAAAPSDPEARLWLGKAYLKARDWDQAVREMEKAVELSPSTARYHLWLGRACGAKASHVFFVKAFGWARRVAKEFETARRLDPKDLDVRFDLLEFYLEAPASVGGGKDKAEAEAREIAKLDPSKGYTARASLLRKDEKWDLAKKELVQATVDYPNADSFKDLAEYLFDQKDYKGALDNAKKALALRAESKRTRLLAAASSIRLRSDLESAARTLQELAEGSLDDEDPSFEEVYYWLGECHLEKGEKDKARKAYLSALVFDPDYDKAKKGVTKTK